MDMNHVIDTGFVLEKIILTDVIQHSHELLWIFYLSPIFGREYIGVKSYIHISNINRSASTT